jgi:hypothetical protein
LGENGPKLPYFKEKKLKLSEYSGHPKKFYFT